MAEAAILAGLGWVLSPVLNKLVNKGLSYFGTNSEDKLKDLEAIILPQIELVLEGAENSQRKDKFVMWLQQLKEVIYEAEDVLDIVEYERIRTRVMENQRNENETHRQEFKPIYNRVTNWSKSALKSTFIDGLRSNIQAKVKTLKPTTSDDAFSLDALMGSKLDQLNQFRKEERRKVSGGDEMSIGLIEKERLKSTLVKLEDVATKAKSNMRELLDVQIPKDKNLISMVPLNTVVGRDTDRRNIIDKLSKPVSLRGGCTALTSLPVVAIFGRAGIGKTTLAQYVCEHEDVKRHFSWITWINVSRPLSIKMIMESVSGTEGTLNDLNLLQGALRMKLRNKKFLLVLDDVWWDKDCIEEWELLFRCLEVGESGSKILITTQETKAAQAFGAIGDNLYQLQDIEEGEFVKHFMRYALPASSTTSPWDLKEFEEIGMKIARKLKRDPTAAKRVGMQLLQKGVEYWREVSENDWLDDTLQAPMRSFRRLPAYLQRCFSFCSIYPKEFEFEESYLISLWIAAGFIVKPQDSSELMEDMVSIAKTYLDDLASMSYFLQLANVGNKDGTYYVVDKSLHDLAERVSKGECFRVEDSKEIPPTVHHLSIWVSEVAEHKENISRLKNLRTLIFMKELDINEANGLGELLKNLKNLRVISMSFRGEVMFLEEMGRLKHLRFLELGNVRVNDPDSFSKLYHLQVLSFTQCLSNVHQNLGNLINLRVLDIISEEACSMPNRLTALRKLGRFFAETEAGYDIGQLCSMKELRFLSIDRLENVENGEKAMEAKLKEKKHLECLHLEWHGDGMENRLDDEHVLESLEPPPKLIKLTVVGYQGRICPSWMMENSCLPCIKSLTLFRCLMEGLPSMKELLPRCETLQLGDLLRLTSLSELPANLTRLVIVNCPRLVVNCEEDVRMRDQERSASEARKMKLKVFLITAIIYDTLHASPLLPPSSLRVLTIKACNITDRAFSACLQGLTALTYLHLVDILSITTLPSEEVLHHLTELRDVRIDSCWCLASLAGLHALHSTIQTVTIMDCPKLAHLPFPVNLSSLHRLTVDNSVLPDKLLSEEGLAYLKELTIMNSKESSFADDRFSRLSSLKSLQMQDCRNLEALPHLPESLERLEIINCGAVPDTAP
ncbi:putative disease resistance protein RGA3 [Typha angustifolia]|uniref:putative disease resistance protein RGA3 n=1 Tax=Typha angustifolia TaxID=59011 RepID=UPI003C2AFF4D